MERHLQTERPGRLRGKNCVNAWQLYVMAAIPFLFIIVFSYLPMFGCVMAFQNYRFDLGILGSEWVGLKNFEFFLKSNDFLIVTRNTLGLNFLFIAVGLAAAIAMALMLFHIRKKLVVKVFQMIYIVPYFLSWVVVGYMTYTILNHEYGTANQFLTMIGMEKVNWYSAPNAWPAILTIASTWKSAGIDSVIYFAALVAIDTSYFDAAKVDGASGWRITRHIILPSIVPLATIMTILKIGNIFRADFGLFYQLTRDAGQLYSTTDVVDTYLYRFMHSYNDIGISSAIGLLQSVVGFVLVIITNWLSKKVDADNGLF